MAIRDEVLGYLEGRPLAVDETRLNNMLHALEFARPVADTSTRRTAPTTRRSSGRTATIPLTGFLDMKSSPMLKYFGGTSLEDFSDSFNRLLEDSSIERIIINTDSPGGSVYGCEECADMIYRARRVKKIDAIANPVAASAAFWLMSQADTTAIIPSGECGSVGCYMLHSDVSEAEAAAGIKRTFVKFGRLKASGNPHEPLHPDALARLQRQVNEYGQKFVAHLARGRDVRAETIRASWGEGMLMTSREAKDKGAVDVIATLDEFIHQGGTRSGKGSKGIAAMHPDLATFAAKAALAGME